MSWIVSLPCTRSEAEALSGELPELDALADAPVVVTREIDEATGRWQLDAYVETRPGAALLTIIQALALSAKRSEAHTSEHQSLLSISSSVLCLNKKLKKEPVTRLIQEQ